MSAEIVLAIFGAALMAIFGFGFWLVQHKIERRNLAEDERDKKIDALAGIPDALTAVSVAVADVREKLTNHLIESSADHALLSSHLISHH